MPLPAYIVNTFISGLVTRVEKEAVPKGGASDSLNWLTMGDRIELRRGYALLGSEKSGSGRISGLKVARRIDGTEIPFSSYDQKVQYYDADTEDNVEVGSDMLPASADGEDISMDVYHSLAGAMLYLSSPNSSIYKIPVANPGNAVDQESTSFRGKIRIKKGAMFLWDRKDSAGGRDTTGLYRSKIDKDELSDFTAISAEVLGSGDGATKAFSGTLAFKSADAKRTCMYVSITDGAETFRDDRNGALVGSAGGTGTINYATGAWAVTFAAAPAATPNNITADYYWEFSGNGGIADFDKSATRAAGEGFVIRQDDGGADFQNLGSIGADEFCFHVLKTWKLTVSSDDSDATNVIYRGRVGIPYFRAMQETGDGVYYVDAQDDKNPAIRLLGIEGGTDSNVIPDSVSPQLDLSAFRFDKAVVFEFGDLILVSCRDQDSTINNRLLAYNKIWKAWDLLDYRASALDSYSGSLICGDSGSNNLFVLFSGLTDEEAEVPNHWISGKTNLDSEGVKVVNRLVMDGLIGPDQELKISLSLDGGPFVEAGTIEGSGSYVDRGQAVTVGSGTIGRYEVGGGTPTSDIVAYHYRRELRINTDRFEKIRIKFEAVKVGYVSVSEYQFKDVRYKGARVPTQYLAN